MLAVLGIVILFGIIISILIPNKQERIANKFVDFVLYKHNVIIHLKIYQGISCTCVDKYGQSLLLEERNLDYTFENDVLLYIAHKIYYKLPQNKFDIIYIDTEDITIKESLEYTLTNTIENKIQLSTNQQYGNSLQEHLRQVAPSVVIDKRGEFIEKTVNYVYASLLREMEKAAKNSVYVNGAQVSATAYINETGLFRIRVKDVKYGNGVLVSHIDKRISWSIAPTTLLLEILTALVDKCSLENIYTSIQIEVSFFDRSSNIKRRITYPLQELELQGDWRETGICVYAKIMALVNY